MATIPTFDTWAAGEKVTAAKMNKNTRDAGNFLKAPPRCVMNIAALQSIPNSAVTQVILNTVAQDNDGMADLVNGWIKINTAGWYLVTTYLGFAANSTGYRGFLIYKGAAGLTASDYRTPAPGISTFATVTAPLVYLNVGDYVQAKAVQNSGAALDCVVTNGAGYLSALWIGA